MMQYVLINKKATRKSKIPRHRASLTKRKFNNLAKVFESNDNLTPPTRINDEAQTLQGFLSNG